MELKNGRICGNETEWKTCHTNQLEKLKVVTNGAAVRRKAEFVKPEFKVYIINERKA